MGGKFGVGGYPGTVRTPQEILNLWAASHGALISGVRTLSSETVAVQVAASSTRCRWVDLSAIGGRIAVGDSSVNVASGTERGVILYPSNLPYRLLIDDLAALYAAGTSARLCYVYLPE